MKNICLLSLILCILQPIAAMDLPTQQSKKRKSDVKLPQAKRRKLNEEVQESEVQKLFAKIPREIEAKIASDMIPDLVECFQNINPVVHLKLEDKRASNVKFFPCGNKIATFDDLFCPVQIFNTHTGELVGSIDPLALSSTRQNIISVLAKRISGERWGNQITDRDYERAQQQLQTGFQSSVQVAINADGSLLMLKMSDVYCRGFREINVYDVKTCKYLHTVPSKHSTAIFSPDGSVIAAIHTNTIDMRDAKTGALLKVLQSPMPQKHNSSRPGYLTKKNIGFSPDGSQLVIRVNNVLQIWNWKKKQTKPQLLQHCNKNGLIRFFQFTHDGAKICTQDEDFVKVWDRATGKLLKTVNGRVKYSITNAMINRDASRVLVGDSVKNGRVISRFWFADLKDGVNYGQLLTWDLAVINKNGSKIAGLIYKNKTIEIADTDTGAIVATYSFEGNPKDVRSIKFSGDSSYLLIKAYHAGIQYSVLNLETKKCILLGSFAKLSPDDFLGYCVSKGINQIMQLSNPKNITAVTQWFKFNMSVMQAAVIKRMYQHKLAGRTEITMPIEHFMLLRRMPADVRATVAKYMGLKIFIKDKESVEPYNYAFTI